MRNPTSGMLRSIFAFTALLVTAGANAQTNVTVEAATDVFNQVLGVSFAPPSTTVLNTDSASLHRLESLTFVTNPSTFFVDLLAADNGGNVLLYATDFTCPPPQACTTGTVVSQAAAIRNPNGLSADPFGNVFAVNNAPGSSPQPQVWALPTDGNGGYKAAVLIDTTNPPGSFGQHQSVVETLSIRTPLGPLLHTGDLLVVSQNPDEILLYPANAVGQLLQSGSGPPIPPQTLIPTCPVQAPACIPAGSTPGGIAVWPADNSLLVTTFGGQILRFGTATGVITSMNPVMGLPAGNLYKINAALANGGPVAYVALSAPGNHGSILQLVPAGNDIQFQTSVTAPGSVQGVAVTNTVQGPESNCLAANGCDLFGDVLNKHTVKPIPGGPKLASTNIVESVCLVPQDPRVSFIGGAWTCNGNPLPVNQVCPGFDNTNGVNPMTIPGYACGASGSNNTAFALIKTLTGPDQFDATYIETEQDPNALFSGATNPVCGPTGTFLGLGLWAPLAGETLLVEENVNIVNPGNANPTPTLVDATEGCGSGKTGTPQVSVFSSGLALSLGGNAGNTQAQLESFVQQKYTNLLTTISELSSGANPNVSAAVASQLTNGNQTGCVDVSLSLFTKAMGEANGSPQQTADFQDAADLLTNADKNNNTTCDSIVTNNAYVKGAFHETPGGAAPIYNPSGQLRWRFANISNAITMRILGQTPASTWPTPVSLSASAQYLFAKCVPPGCPPQQNPSTATLSWALVNGASCGWNSNDSYFMAHQPNLANSHATVGPFTDPGTGTTYTYTLNCTGLPVGTMPGGGTTMSVSTNVTVWPAVVVTPSAQSVVANNSVQVNWTPPAGATACTLAFSGQGSWNSGSKTFVQGPATNPPATYAASYLAVSKDVSKGVTFYATCTAGASAGVNSITVTHH